MTALTGLFCENPWSKQQKNNKGIKFIHLAFKQKNQSIFGSKILKFFCHSLFVQINNKLPKQDYLRQILCGIHLLPIVPD